MPAASSHSQRCNFTLYHAGLFVADRRRSESACKPAHIFALVPKYLANRRAVSAVMPRFPKTISLIPRGGARLHKFFAKNFARVDRWQYSLS